MNRRRNSPKSLSYGHVESDMPEEEHGDAQQSVEMTLRGIRKQKNDRDGDFDDFDDDNSEADQDLDYPQDEQSDAEGTDDGTGLVGRPGAEKGSQTLSNLQFMLTAKRFKAIETAKTIATKLELRPSNLESSISSSISEEPKPTII